MKTATPILLAALLATSGCAHKQWAKALEGDASIEVTPGQGAGNVTIGMGQGKVKRRLGQPAVVDRMMSGALYWTYPQLGMSVKFEDGAVDSLFCYSGVRGGYETQHYEPFPGATSEGVTVTTPQREVLETYGRPAAWESDDRAPIPVTWMRYDGIGFCYTQKSKQLVYVYVDEPR